MVSLHVVNCPTIEQPNIVTIVDAWKNLLEDLKQHDFDDTAGEAFLWDPDNVKPMNVDFIELQCEMQNHMTENTAVIDGILQRLE